MGLETIALVGLGLSAAGTIGGLATRPKAPKPRNLGNELNDTLTAQERTFDRQSTLNRKQAFDALGLQTDLLTGGSGPGSTLWTDASGTPLEAEWQRYLNDPLSTDRDKLAAQHGFKSTYQPGTGQPGLLSTYNTLLSQFGPQFGQSMAAADPQRGRLEDMLLAGATKEAALQGGPLDRLTEQDAISQLDYGSQLDPVDRRTLQQGVRSAQAARGMGYGPSDVGTEALAELAGGQALRQSRQNYALGAAANSRASRGQAANTGSAISASRFNTNVAPLLNALGMGSNLQQSTQFNPFNSYAEDLNNTNYNAAAAANIARYNSAQSAFGGLTSLGGSLFNAGMTRPVGGMSSQGGAYAGDLIQRYGLLPQR